MKIFLTEIEEKGKKYAGPNIVAENLAEAKEAAKANNLTFNKFVKYVKDRPFNDYRYSLNFNKIMRLGWKPKTKIEDKISEINDWYKKNISRFKKR